MAFNLADRVRETSTTTGTGAYALAGAVSGFRTFSSAIGNTNSCTYVATMGTQWEVGIGTVTSSGPSLSRATILASSNAGAAVNWTAGAKDIRCDAAAVLFSAPSVRVFTASGSFTLGSTRSVAIVHCIGGGGGGGGVIDTGVGYASGAGGGGGGYSMRNIPAASFTGTVTVTIGAGGAAGPASGGGAGGTGGTTSFGSFCSASGGAGGAGAIANTSNITVLGGAGGIGSGGDVNLRGGAGGPGMALGAINVALPSGAGGMAPHGGGGGGSSKSSNGGAGGNYGGGGSGASTAPSLGSHTGGAGAAGVVWVEDF